jgi:hypothetical protein
VDAARAGVNVRGQMVLAHHAGNSSTPASSSCTRAQ